METWRSVLAREISRSTRVAIIGVGHIARGDDAAGTLAARLLLEHPARLPAKALVIEAGEAPENYTGPVRAFRPDLAVILDAARSGRRPGSVFLIDPAEIADEDVSTHRVPLTRLARYIRETMDCRVVIVGIEPANLEKGEEARLSPAVGRAVRAVGAALERALVRSSSASGRRCS
jgi:hydrogenase 3 maturation protease